MEKLPDTTMALLRKLFNAGTDENRWEDLTPAEQHLAKDLDGGLVDFEPRWQPTPGQTAMMAVGQRVLASQSGRLEVLRPIIADLLPPHVDHVTREQVLAACHKREIKITGTLLDQVFLHLDCLADGKAHLHEFVVHVDPKTEPPHYIFSRQ